MKWLITGCNGQLGNCLQDKLKLREGDDFRALDSDLLDITDELAVKAEITSYMPDVVINAAAYTAVDKAESEEEIATRVNAHAPGILARACEEAGIWFVHVSTDYVFDGNATVAYREEDPVSPCSVYGSSKLKGEELVSESCRRHLIVRTAWVFSEYGGNFVKTMLRLAQERDRLSVVADQFGCPTYAGDIADCLLRLVLLAQNGKAEAGIYHFSGDLAVSWWSFTREIHAMAVSKGMLDKAPLLEAIPTSAYPTAAQRPAFSVLDCAKLEAIGIRPSDWRRGLSHVLDCARK